MPEEERATVQGGGGGGVDVELDVNIRAAVDTTNGAKVQTVAGKGAQADWVNAVPAWTRLDPANFALVISIVFSVISVGIIVLNVYTLASGQKVM